MVGERIKCDGSGCITSCCKGCSCCMAKTGIIQSKDNEITGLKQRILELMTRQTTIGSAGSLSQENQRLRTERDHYWVISSEFKKEKEQADELVKKLTTSLTNLTAKVKRLEKDNQELKNKVEGINKQIETPSKC
jgi:chromosome segregation ATPase